MTPLPLPTTMVLAHYHTMTERIEKLCKAIENEHNCSAKHAGSVFVTVMDGLLKVWKGSLEVFLLEGHREATICYGWREFDGQEVKYVTVLEIPPVNSPESAVRAAIARATEK